MKPTNGLTNESLNTKSHFVEIEFSINPFRLSKSFR